MIDWRGPKISQTRIFILKTSDTYVITRIMPRSGRTRVSITRLDISNDPSVSRQQCIRIDFGVLPNRSVRPKGSRVGERHVWVKWV